MENILMIFLVMLILRFNNRRKGDIRTSDIKRKNQESKKAGDYLMKSSQGGLDHEIYRITLGGRRWENRRKEKKKDTKGKCCL